jgi:positive regulator of sigma E activity
VLAPQWESDTEGLSALFGLLGLAAGFLWLNRYNRSLSKDKRFMATILRTNPDAGLHRISLNL